MPNQLSFNKYSTMILSCLSILLMLTPAVTVTAQDHDAAALLQDQGYSLTTEFPLQMPTLTDEQDYIELNENIPYFSNEDITNTNPWISFTDLDHLLRVGPANAVLNSDLMPATVRQDASDIYPTGWEQSQYHGENLYNRSHLLGFQLIGDGILPLNLMTGTRQFNAEGMLPFENYVASVVETGLTVRYRISPYFIGDNLLAHGVIMEGFSIEDNGESLSFNIFVPNRQDGIQINYATGENSEYNYENQAASQLAPVTILYYPYPSNESLATDTLEEEITTHEHSETSESEEEATTTYVANANTGKFHYAHCSSVKDMAEHNKVFLEDYDHIIAQGYVPCKRCNPK